MKPLTHRDLISELAIGAAICVGAYFLLVDPVDKDLGSTREAISQAQAAAQQAQSNALSPLAAAQAVKNAASFRETLTARSEPALSQSAMFTAIMSAAEQAGTRVDELQPVTPPSRAARSPDAPKPLAGDAHTGYAMTVTAEYGALARFVSILENDLGLTAVTSVRISPLTEAGSTKVHASIDTQHWAFDLRPAVASADGAAAAPGTGAPR